MRKAVIYARFSSEKQNEVSIEGQVRVCSDYAARKGYEVVHEYVDRAVSGKTDKRDAFQRMLRDSATAEWSAVIVYKLDRFARNRIESAVNRSTLKKNGVSLLSAQEEIPETPEGVLLESLIEGLNEYFSLELAQKVSRSFYDLRLKGQFLGGKTPYGYKIVDKHYVINEEQAEKIRYVFSAIENGRRIKDVAVELEHEPCNWYRIVKNIKYAGCLVHQGEIIENAIPAIVPRAQFERVQEVLRKQGKSYRPAYGYPLSGKVFCGVCGGNVTGGVANGKGGKYRYYRCTTTRAEGCDLRGINADELEDAVVDFALGFLKDEGKRAVIAAQIIKSLQERNDTPTLRSLRARQTSLARKRDNIIDGIAEMGSSAALRAKLNDIERQMGDVVAEIEALQLHRSMTERKVIDYLKRFAENPPDKARALILRDLVERVDCFNDHIEVKFRTPVTPPTSPTSPPPPEPAPKGGKSSSKAGFGVPRVPLLELGLAVQWDFWAISFPRRQ